MQGFFKSQGINSKERIELLRSNVNSLHNTLTGHTNVWGPGLQKKLESIKMLDDELLEQNDSGELSITAQIIIEQSIDKVNKIADEYMREHKELHNSVSKIGKTIDRHFTKEIGALFQMEKDLHNDKNLRQETCGLIFDFLQSEGLHDIAGMLKKEAELEEKVESVPTEAMNKVMRDLANHEIASAQNFIDEFAPHEQVLRYDLQKQWTLRLLIDGKEKEARESVKFLKKYDQEHARVITAVVQGESSIEDPRYADLFSEHLWENLMFRVAQVMSPTKSDLIEIIAAGGQIVSVLHGLKKTLPKGGMAVETELPVEYNVKRLSHSVFSCPIMKEQSSERNPPMKLVCGHVISKDAMGKLLPARISNSRVSSRPVRMKCPYCPKEQTLELAKQVNFCNVISS